MTTIDLAPLTRGVAFEEVSTYQEVAARAQSVRALLAELQIRLHRDSALATILRSAERIAEDYNAGRPLHDVKEFVLAVHANRVASALLAVGRQQGARECLCRMTGGTLDPSQRSASSGKDALWEIELAAILRAQGLSAQLEEPDLVVDVGGQRYPIACKKVYSERGVEAQMRKGVKQLERFGAPGLVAFNIDELTPADSVFVSDDHEGAGNQLAGLNRAFIDRHQQKLQRFVAEGRCHGVLATTCVIADLANTQQRLNTFTQTTIWTLASPHAPRSDAFASILGILGGSISDSTRAAE